MICYNIGSFQALFKYRLRMLTPEQQQRAIATLLTRKENHLCADCNGKSPCWASLDFGVFICMNCAGAHRALGQSITRVKSTKLDTWNRDWLQKMKVGNAVLNEYWQKQLVNISIAQKPGINTSLEDIITFVQDKYVHKKYADPNQQLSQVIKHSQIMNSSSTQRSQSVQNHNIKPIALKHPSKIQQPIKSGHESPFSAFDNIIQNKLKQEKKTNVGDNLISFDVPKQAKEKPPQSSVQKYNHSHFYSIAGGDNKPDSKVKVDNDQFASFDNLIKQKINNSQSKTHKKGATHNFAPNPNPNSNSNPNPNPNPNSNTSSNKHSYIPHHYNGRSHFGGNSNTNQVNPFCAKSFDHFDSYFLLTPSQKPKTQTKSPSTVSNITLQPSPPPSGTAKKQVPKSWIDEWK